MTKFLDRYLSFNGRLARLPFFARSVSLGVIAGVLLFTSIPLFSNGGRFWWWMGLAIVLIVLAFFAGGVVSLLVRRLHDLGLSGFHAIWVGIAQVGGSILSYAPPKVILFTLPVFLINLWLAFWPGNKNTNRFGEAPQ
jgi:uncharacterized membrane protein YhaH (DUF805 family)